MELKLLKMKLSKTLTLLPTLKETNIDIKKITLCENDINTKNKSSNRNI